MIFCQELQVWDKYDLKYDLILLPIKGVPIIHLQSDHETLILARDLKAYCLTLSKIILHQTAHF